VTSGLLASQSQLVGDANPDLSKLLSVAAWRLNPSSAARHAMFAAAARPGIAVLNASGSVNSVAFSPDGKTLATGTNDGSVWLWDLATRQAGRLLTASGFPVHSVAFSPDGKTLAAGSNDGSVRLWGLATHRPIGGRLIINGPGGPVTSVAFSPDGKILAAGSNDGTGGTVWLWDLATHQPIATPLINGPGGSVSSVAFSPHGKTLAIGTYDGSVWLQDVATRQPGRRVTAEGFSVYSVAFSPDGKTLATGNIDFTVRLWNVATPSDSLADTTNLVRYLCVLAGRHLTRAEWAQYVPHLPYQPVCP
jgi:WD40 repeat protein